MLTAPEPQHLPSLSELALVCCGLSAFRSLSPPGQHAWWRVGVNSPVRTGWLSGTDHLDHWPHPALGETRPASPPPPHSNPPV